MGKFVMDFIFGWGGNHVIGFFIFVKLIFRAMEKLFIFIAVLIFYFFIVYSSLEFLLSFFGIIITENSKTIITIILCVLIILVTFNHKIITEFLKLNFDLLISKKKIIKITNDLNNEIKNLQHLNQSVKNKLEEINEVFKQ